VIGRSRIGRGRLCDTDIVTSTRQWEPRPGVGPAALTDLEIADGVQPAVGRIGVTVGTSRAAALEPTTETLGASFGGWTAGAGAWGGPHPLGKEVR